MIEASRYVLAMIVAQTHLWPQGPDGPGQISVFAFYTLSGYLMTRVLNERYGFTIGERPPSRSMGCCGFGRPIWQ